MPSNSSPAQQSVDVDVAVVGAGAAGLIAARALKRAGLRVAVVEARDRFGGRLLTHRLENGAIVDLGAQWVAPTQRRVLSLVEETGASIFQHYDAGKSILHVAGETSAYEGDLSAGVDEDVAAEIDAMQRELDRIGTTIPLDAPWDTPDAANLDRITYDEWVRSNSKTEIARNVMLSVAPGVLSSEACDLSFLHVAFYFASGGGFRALTGVIGAAQDSRFTHGFQTLFSTVAEELSEETMLETIVTTIEHRDDGVTLHTDKAVITAKRAIVAMSPAIAGRIRYSPPLPGLRDQLTQRMPMGTAIKMLISYERPFWRDTGLNGFAMADYPLSLTYDISPDDASCGILLGFIEGDAARQWGARTTAEREEAAIDWLEKIYGPEARNYTQYIDKYWVDEEFSRGCFAGAMPPGVWTSFGRALAAPIGSLHWAGTETATFWMGYVEGAMQSGERAAAEVIAALEIERH